MIDPDFMDEQMDWHASMTHDTDYMEMLSESSQVDFHERVKMGQKASARQTKSHLPSETSSVYWLYAVREKGQYKSPNADSGKWLVFVPPDLIDTTWDKIRELTEQGKLGGESKVSTQRGRQGERDFVICVYTYDWTDKVDCLRVREALRAAGVTKRIPYKADADTLAGRYAGDDERPLSKYYL